jgi:hypothetical protein
MKLDQILSLWKEDSVIDITNLGEEAIKIANLTQKYYEILVQERVLLRKYQNDYKVLNLEKYEFYTQGPNEETEQKGWALPSKGIIIKSEIPIYLDADKDLIELSLKIGIQQEKVQLLETIIKSLKDRGFNIRAALDDRKLKEGV